MAAGEPNRETPFEWPEGRRAAISITFDDARASQVDAGLAILGRHGVKASFYVVPGSVERRLAGWRLAVAEGHEIGNHTCSHPCSCNHPFSRNNALENYTLERMQEELDGCNRAIRQLLGVEAETFAYPCGQKFVGRGQETRSYVPLVARRFLAGRGAFDERHNSPGFCDLAQIFGVDMDRTDMGQLKARFEELYRERGWLVLFAHEVGAEAAQSIRADVLEELCRYCQDPANGIWVDTVAAVARHIRRVRGD